MRIATVVRIFTALAATALPLEAAPPSGGIPLRVMTYNIHSCKGRDGKVRPDRIAQVIAQYHPDVVALQEVRVGRVSARTVDRTSAEGPVSVGPAVGEPPLPPPEVIPPRSASETASGAEPVPFTDQPGAIAAALGMRYVFYPLVRSKTEDYGIALLSRYPMRLVRAENLPTLERRKPFEKRGAVWAEIDVDGSTVQVLNTHLGLNSEERAAQVEALVGEEWLASPKFHGPFVLCGDFNSRPSQWPYKRLAKAALDAPNAVFRGKAPATWPSSKAFFRIDHVFIPKTGGAVAAEVPRTPLTRVASDHLPLIVDVLIPKKEEMRPEVGKRAER